MVGWRWNRRVATWSLVAFLLIQLALPITRMFGDGDRSQRLGWQMFAYASTPAFVVVSESGEQPVDLFEVLARPRGDLPLEQVVPPQLCSTVDGALRIIWGEGSYEC